jgi:catechol 2,3-dioxygenase-like lactoylglutathione lyase family enzyme
LKDTNEEAFMTTDIRPAGLTAAHTVTKLPAQDLERARTFYRELLGLEPVEERPGGLRYLCAVGEFHLFQTAGAPSGTSTQMGFEVDDLDATMAELRARGVVFTEFDGIPTVDGVVEVAGNYPTKGSGERGAWFYDSEGNLLGLGQATGGAGPHGSRGLS